MTKTTSYSAAQVSQLLEQDLLFKHTSHNHITKPLIRISMMYDGTEYLALIIETFPYYYWALTICGTILGFMSSPLN